jgi:hypothetical protein
MWKHHLQQFADRTGITTHVSHFPPGTSKWNKIEHRLFCYISKNWQGKPLVDVQTAVDLTGSTTTATGLKVICVRDDTGYELAKKVSDDEFKTINTNTNCSFRRLELSDIPPLIGSCYLLTVPNWSKPLTVPHVSGSSPVPVSQPARTNPNASITASVHIVNKLFFFIKKPLCVLRARAVSSRRQNFMFTAQAE